MMIVAMRRELDYLAETNQLVANFPDNPQYRRMREEQVELVKMYALCAIAEAVTPDTTSEYDFTQDLPF